MADKGVATGTQRAPVVTVEMQLARLRNLTDLLKQAGITGPVAGAGEQPSTATPRAAEGAYYIDDYVDECIDIDESVDGHLVRRDIVEDRKGVPLDLRITVLDAVRRIPIGDAAGSVWHADALGWYSGHLADNPDVFALDAHPEVAHSLNLHIPPSDSSRFLRGLQRTDDRGVVEFRTIYPGWYYGRAIRIHMKVRVDGREVYTGQSYFPEEYNRIVAILSPYREHTTLERMTNELDPIYQMGGRQTTLAVEPVSPGKPELGLRASITVAIAPGSTSPKRADLGQRT